MSPRLAPLLRTGAVLAMIGFMTAVVTFSAQALQGLPNASAGPDSARAVLTDGGVASAGTLATALRPIGLPALRDARRPRPHRTPPAPVTTLVKAPLPTAASTPPAPAPAVKAPAPPPVVRAPVAPAKPPATAPAHGPSFDSSG
jgi:hypothetical protein